MSRVCVTGAAGYIATWLVKKLLGRGCVVHATLRDLGNSLIFHGDEKKTALLRRMPGAAERLVLFEADMYDAATFEPAIAGCEFVFLLATPLQHDPTSTKYKNNTEAAVDAMRVILQQCERSKTVRRVIHTASVTAASPLREDHSGGYKDFINESCWSPLNLTYDFTNAHLNGYVSSKSLSEKELLSYNSSSSPSPAFEVVTLACALVGGDTLQPCLWSSIPVIVSPLTGDELYHNALKFMQALLGSVPLAHIDDVCDAHVFCMDQPSIAGRFLCAAGYPNMKDYIDRFAAKREREREMSRVCVTGASGYIAAYLVKKLLERGCVVHGTLRNLGDEKKTAPLRELPGAADRLVLFEADMYDADTFEPAIAGCEYVFLVATPMHHDPTSTKYKNTAEATTDAMRIILNQCERSRTGYVSSKTLSEKELLSYNGSSPSPAFEVVTLACAVVGGDTLQPCLWSSIPVILAPLTGDEPYHNSLKFLQALLGSVPLVHIEDACDAHVFCMDQPSIAGRFLCAAGYPNMKDCIDHFAAKFPDIEIKLKEVIREGVRVQADTNKLVDLGFKYRYGVEETLDSIVECAKRLGEL
uniref:NAD-dependent epimerase/dehydratase domain-containing protein n=1 Tax=Oryza glumipatula TaxID=40148 RepID=A0A0E0AMB5_9ORYZ